MTAHLALESLSALLDGEAPTAGRARAASHLVACPECRHRLEGLRSVARSLAALERTRPPRALDLALTNLARPGAAERRRPGLVRFEAPVVAGPLALPLVAVLGLAVMLFALVAHWAARPQEGTGPAAPRLLRLNPAPLAVDGVELSWQGEIWRERIIGPDIATGPVRIATAFERDALLRDRPELTALVRREAVELWVGGEWLRLEPEPATGSEGGAGQDLR